MSDFNPHVDRYIQNAPEFARPVLTHLRALVHAVRPDIAEVIKWGFPHFDYKGLLCGMVSYQKHCSFGFWKGEIMKDPHRLLVRSGEGNSRLFAKIKSLADLPVDAISLEYIAEACLLNENNIRVPPKPKVTEELVIPSDLREALAADEDAAATFDSLTDAGKKEFIKWITEAKTEMTRGKRLATTIELLRDGKRLYWKYEKF